MTDPTRPASTTVVVMGVSGSGKTTVATQAAERLGWKYSEGDDFHPPANVEKMRAGHPLDDEDRWPWLSDIATWIGDREKLREDVVITCSALKRAYREVLRDGHPSVVFCQLVVPAEVLEERMAHRRGHYMPASLLHSQLETLQDLQPDERGFQVRVEGGEEKVLADVLRHLEPYLA
ncbi:gluconokinase [Kineococcus sp. SYSU DK006]|uniref:gluconokinase n=1 Tax=Kineococcus sp. SYSU DK006 TaxID=3383127 RepID=UPI003D7C8907